MDTAIAYSPGLEGVAAGVTALSRIDTDCNILTYRGYNIADLCENATFEEVAYLLLLGVLPTRAELAEFAGWLEEERAVPEGVYEPLRALPPNSDPMHWLQTLVSMLAGFDSRPGDNGHDANLERAVSLLAKMPALVANGWRVLNGEAPLPPEGAPSGHAAYFLRTLTGSEPDEFAARLLNVTLILYAEHGFNASTFAARVTVSTLSDLYSGVVSALGALKGPLHGGANEEVMRTLLEIGDAANVEPWLRRRLTKSPDNPRPRVMGFGHREYRNGDQRARIAGRWLRDLAAHLGEPRWVAIEDALEAAMLREKGLHPNLDFPVSPAYYMLGLPIPLYTPIFAMSRVVGWSAHIIEQLDNNRLIRPTNLYDGPSLRPWLPMEERDLVLEAA